MDAVKDMLGREIKTGSVLLVAKNGELKLAEVETISLNYTRGSDRPTLSLRLVGRRSDARFIGTAMTITEPTKYAVAELPAATTPTPSPSSVTFPTPMSNILIGSGIS